MIHLFGKIKISQVQMIVLGMLLGILCGFILENKAQPLEYLGIFFLHLIKMVTIPIIFFTIIYGTTNIENQTGLLKLGKKALIAFLLTSTLAVILGIVTSLIIRPGEGLDITIPKPSNTSSSVHKVTNPLELLVNIIPQNIFLSLTEGNILQVIIFSFFIGIVLNSNREKCQDIIKVCHQSAHIFFEMIRKIMYIAPFGVFGYIASMVGTQGLEIVEVLAKLIFAILAASIVQYIVFGILILLFVRVSPIPFYKKLAGVQMMAFSTSSSKATLANLIQVSEETLGISKRSSRFLLPLSAALNMDGGAIYQASCAIFFAQLTGISLSYSDYGTILFMSTIASIGGAGIPGGVLLFLGMVLSSVGLPAEGVILVASVDRVLDMITTLINVTGDACVTLLVDNSEGTFNKKRYND